MAPIEITGNVRNHFIQAAVLLHMLDPVRGEPTVHGLDQDLNDRSALRFQELKRKFLDSFAFLCATKKDGDSVSAACMEEGLPQGTIIRIASNAGVRENTLCQLRQVLDSLNSVAGAVLDASTAETEILLKIITLDIAKIRYYLKDIRATKNILEEPVSAIELRLRESSTSILHTDPSALQRFLKWFRQVFEIRDLPLDPEPTVLIRYIRWAQEAKQHYLEFLKGAFSTNTQQLPRWVCTVFKLGRYGIACKVLVQLASEIPALFNPMIVKPVPAPVSTRFTFPEQELPLTCVLRRVVRRSADKYLSRLATVWNTVDPEALFRTACPLNLTVHAEMQLLNFYDHNCQFKPSFRFMGEIQSPYITVEQENGGNGETRSRKPPRFLAKTCSCRIHGWSISLRFDIVEFGEGRNSTSCQIVERLSGEPERYGECGIRKIALPDRGCEPHAI